jgi:hypothetical protein
MKHLRLVNTARVVLPVAGKEASDICLVDYSHCPVRDLCWVIDAEGGCVTADGCIFDLS